MFVCKSLFAHGKSSVELTLKTRTNYNCFTRLRCGNSIYQLLSWYFSTDAAFFWISVCATQYSITWPRCKRSFVSNNWCLVWTGSAFPQSFLSCKQSDAERKDFVDIPEQGHSCFYISLRLFVSFVEEISSPSRGWREGGLSSYQRII